MAAVRHLDFFQKPITFEPIATPNKNHFDLNEICQKRCLEIIFIKNFGLRKIGIRKIITAVQTWQCNDTHTFMYVTSIKITSITWNVPKRLTS